MKLLIGRGLMFGTPIRVNSRAWIGFCNRALEKLTAWCPEPGECHIVLTGDLPGVGDQPGNLGCLGPKNGNRQFIPLLAPHDKRALLDRSCQGWDARKQTCTADHLARECQLDRPAPPAARIGPRPLGDAIPKAVPPPGFRGMARLRLDEGHGLVPALPWGAVR